MKHLAPVRLLGLMALGMAFSATARAADSDWFAGANLGHTGATLDDPRIEGGLSQSGLATTSISNNADSVGFKLYGGYQFNRNFSLEGGYFDLGKFGFNATTSPEGTLDGHIRLRGVDLDAVGTWPLSQRFSVFGVVGLNYAQARDSFSGTGAVSVMNANPSKSDLEYKFGAGVQYALSDGLALRAEAERYRINDAVGNHGDIDFVSVGLTYRFGRKVPASVAPVAPTAAPLPLAVAAPPPAPLPAPVVAPTPPQQVSLSADSLFEFDRATVTAAGRQSLDQFTSALRGTRYEVITVTGHTDRIGTAPYNLKLSERRADAVKTYMVGTSGIDPAKIVTAGVGDASPVTNPGDCPGKSVTPALIACLAPDRRVDIEVSGNR